MGDRARALSQIAYGFRVPLRLVTPPLPVKRAHARRLSRNRSRG